MTGNKKEMTRIRIKKGNEKQAKRKCRHTKKHDKKRKETKRKLKGNTRK